MKMASSMFIIMGVINLAFALMQGFIIPAEQQVNFSISSREYFLYSFIIFALGLRMYQKAKELEE